MVLGTTVSANVGHINKTQSIHLSVEGDSYRVVEPLKRDDLEKWYKTEEIEDEDEEELIVEGDDEDDADLYEIDVTKSTYRRRGAGVTKSTYRRRGAGVTKSTYRRRGAGVTKSTYRRRGAGVTKSTYRRRTNVAKQSKVFFNHEIASENVCKMEKSKMPIPFSPHGCFSAMTSPQISVN